MPKFYAGLFTIYPKIAIYCFVLVGLLGFSNQIGGTDFSVYDLVNEVNQLRISNGLPPLNVNGTIMAIAQDHSEYQAGNHQSSHSGRYGEIVTSRVEASGYGLGSKIVAGENVAGFSYGMEDMLSVVVYQIWADPVHRGAMLNPKYQDIGAGIADDGETVYITLNLAGIVESSPSISTPPSVNSTSLPENPISDGTNPLILPLQTSTPQNDGTLYHIVGYGQTLSTIARIYNVNIEELARLNQIEPDNIFTGQKLLISTGNILASTITSPVSISEIPSPSLTSTPVATSTFTPTSNPEIQKSVEVNTKEVGLILIYVLLGSISLLFFANYLRINQIPK